MGAKSSAPVYEVIDGRAYDKKTGKLRRAYYDHHGIIRFQLIEKEHNGPLEFEIVSRYNQTAPPFNTGDSVFVMHTRWVGEWAAFAGNGDKQPGPISNHKLIGNDGKFKKHLMVGEHWRAVTKWHFLFFVCTYGLNGPVIEFKAPQFCDDVGDGSRLQKKDKTEGAGKEETKEEVKKEEENDEEEEGDAPPVKAEVLGTKAPPWLKLVDLERHCLKMSLNKISASVNAFVTGLPYGENLQLEDDESMKGLNAAGSILTSTEVRASSAHVLSIFDAKASGRKRLCPLFVVMAAHTFMEAGARRARIRAARERKEAKRARRIEKFKQKKSEFKARKLALEKFEEQREEKKRLSLAAGQEEMEPLFPGSPVVAAGIYGEELKLLAKAGKVLKDFKAAKQDNAGKQALIKYVALTFKFGGKCMGRRRLNALRVPNSAPSESLKHGAVKVLQVAWRQVMAQCDYNKNKSADKASMVPLAVALIQINWRISLETLAKRKARRAYKAERKAIAVGKAVSAVQKALRNRMDRKKVQKVRNTFRTQILAFAAVKVQIAWRRNYMHRLNLIANGEEDEEDEEELDRQLFGVKTAKQAKLKRDAFTLQHKKDLAARVALVATKKASLTRSLSNMEVSMKKEAIEALEAKRSQSRPISFKVIGCSQVPLHPASMKDVMQSDLFFVVTALPSPPPPECLIGADSSTAATAAKRRASGVNLLSSATGNNTSDAKFIRGACYSMPAKSVHGTSTDSSGERNGINVQWKQEVCLSGDNFDGKSTLVFTILKRPPKKNSVLAGNRDEFVAQATIKLSDLPDLWSNHQDATSPALSKGGGGASATTTANKKTGDVDVELKLGELKCRVWDGKGNKLKMDKKEASGGGSLRVSFIRQNEDSLFSGWLQASTQSLNDIKSAKASDSIQVARRWLLLTNDRLSVQETPCAEPDIEIALATIKGCRVDKTGLLCVDFDRAEAVKLSVKRGRGGGSGGAGQGVSAGSFGFGTGPSNVKASVAVQSGGLMSGVLMLTVDHPNDTSLANLRKCIEKALFLRAHGDS